LGKWRKQKKISSRVENLQPGEWFKTNWAEFQKLTAEYQAKQKEFKAKPAQPPPEKKEKKDDDEPEEEEPKKPDVDLGQVQDVCDIGTGEPLFSNFTFEDWELLKLRCELYFMITSFNKDVDDPERPGIHTSQFGFYCNRYYNRAINPKGFGKDSVPELTEHVKDTVGIDSDTGILICTLPADAGRSIPDFVKLQETNRRERQRRVDAGDESVRLDFQVLRQQLEVEKRRADAAAARLQAAKQQALNPRSQAPATAGQGASRGQATPWQRQPAAQTSWNSEQKASWTPNPQNTEQKATWTRNPQSTEQKAAWTTNPQQAQWNKTSSEGVSRQPAKWEYAPRKEQSEQRSNNW